MSVVSNMTAKERKLMEKNKRELERKRKAIRKFMDEEAELGSDDEENDDGRRDIDRGDAEENEEGLDDDLDGFVVYGADDEEIADPDSDAYRRHQEFLEMQDRMELQQTMDAVIFGNNKKRKRGEFESDLDDDSKRKLKMREERFQ